MADYQLLGSDTGYGQGTMDDPSTLYEASQDLMSPLLGTGATTALGQSPSTQQTSQMGSYSQMHPGYQPQADVSQKMQQHYLGYGGASAHMTGVGAEYGTRGMHVVGDASQQQSMMGYQRIQSADQYQYGGMATAGQRMLGEAWRGHYTNSGAQQSSYSAADGASTMGSIAPQHHRAAQSQYSQDYPMHVPQQHGSPQRPLYATQGNGPHAAQLAAAKPQHIPEQGMASYPQTTYPSPSRAAYASAARAGQRYPGQGATMQAGSPVRMQYPQSAYSPGYPAAATSPSHLSPYPTQQAPNSPQYRGSYPSPRRPTPTPPGGSPMPATSQPSSQGGYPSPGATHLSSPGQVLSPGGGTAPASSLQQLEQMVMPHTPAKAPPTGTPSPASNYYSGPQAQAQPYNQQNLGYTALGIPQAAQIQHHPYPSQMAAPSGMSHQGASSGMVQRTRQPMTSTSAMSVMSDSPYDTSAVSGVMTARGDGGYSLGAMQRGLATSPYHTSGASPAYQQPVGSLTYEQAQQQLQHLYSIPQTAQTQKRISELQDRLRSLQQQPSSSVPVAVPSVAVPASSSSAVGSSSMGAMTSPPGTSLGHIQSSPGLGGAYSSPASQYSQTGPSVGSTAVSSAPTSVSYTQQSMGTLSSQHAMQQQVPQLPPYGPQAQQQLMQNAQLQAPLLQSPHKQHAIGQQCELGLPSTLPPATGGAVPPTGPAPPPPSMSAQAPSSMDAQNLTQSSITSSSLTSSSMAPTVSSVPASSMTQSIMGPSNVVPSSIISSDLTQSTMVSSTLATPNMTSSSMAPSNMTPSLYSSIPDSYRTSNQPPSLMVDPDMQNSLPPLPMAGVPSVVPASVDDMCLGPPTPVGASPLGPSHMDPGGPPYPPCPLPPEPPPVDPYMLPPDDVLPPIEPMVKRGKGSRGKKKKGTPMMTEGDVRQPHLGMGSPIDGGMMPGPEFMMPSDGCSAMPPMLGSSVMVGAPPLGMDECMLLPAVKKPKKRKPKELKDSESPKEPKPKKPKKPKEPKEPKPPKPPKPPKAPKEGGRVRKSKAAKAASANNGEAPPALPQGDGAPPATIGEGGTLLGPPADGEEGQAPVDDSTGPVSSDGKTPKKKSEKKKEKKEPKTPKDGVPKPKAPKKKLPRLSLKFSKKKKAKRLGSSDQSDIEGTPPPSPVDGEGVQKRRSSRNTHRKKYTDDIELQFSGDEALMDVDQQGARLALRGQENKNVQVLVNVITEDTMVVEKVLASRMATRKSEDEDGEAVDVEEFFVKYKNLSYIHCDWKTLDELEATDKRVLQKVKRFRQKRDNIASIFDFLEDEPFNPEYVEVDRILDMTETVDPLDDDDVPLNEGPAERMAEEENAGQVSMGQENEALKFCDGENTKLEEPCEDLSGDKSTRGDPMEVGEPPLSGETVKKEDNEGEEQGLLMVKKEESDETKNLVVDELNGEVKPAVIEIKKENEDAEKNVEPAAEKGKPRTKVSRHYLVKWRGLSYEESTWELEEDVDRLKIEHFLRFKDLPPKEKWKVKKRPKPAEWKKLEESPVYRGGNTLREYQLEGLSWLTFCWYNGQNCILADEMGLGKTIQSLTYVNEIVKYGIGGPFLVIAPLSTIGNWQREFETWTDLNVITYHGSSASRNMIQEYEMYYKDENGQRVTDVYKFQVMITTFEIVLSDCMELVAIPWRACVIDEAHRLKNRNCKLLEGLRMLNIEHSVLLTGTPLQNNVEELFSLLNFLEPARFNSTETFMEEFGDLKTEGQVDKLKALLKPMMLRRLKEDVEKSLAPKEETIVEVELTNIQKKYYRAILERNFAFLTKGGVGTNVPNLMNTMMELRKCCIHPYLIKGAEEQILQEYRVQHGDSLTLALNALVQASGKLVLLDKLLPRLKEGGHRVLVFSQMVRCLDLLEDYLVHKRYPYERIDGRVRGNLRQAAIDRYCKPDSDRFVFLLCTRAGGLGINLTAADTVVIFDSDWNPQNDLQAQARCHRIGQSKAVKVYRLICRNTYEREMFDKASLKLGLDRAVLQSMNAQKENIGMNQQLTKQEIEDLLRKGAYGALMDDDAEGETFCEEDIDQILLRRTHTITLESEGKGSTFSKASFTASSTRSDIDVDDPNFWEKWAKKANLDVDELKSRNDLILQEPRRRTQTKRFGTDDHMLDLSELESSDDDEDGSGMRTRTGSRHRNKLRDSPCSLGSRIRRGGRGRYFNDDDFLGELAPGNWTRTECFQVEKGLLTFGWGRWKESIAIGLWRRRVTVKDVEEISRVVLLYCLRHYKGDEKIKGFIWDLIAPTEDGETKIHKNHSGLSAPVPRGRKGKKLKQNGKGEPDSPDMLADWARDDQYNPDILLNDDGYRKHLHRHANKVLLRVRLLYYLKHEIIGELHQQVVAGVPARDIPIPPPTADGEPPAPWWDEEADKSLLVGVYKHGYERFNLMRQDHTLCFLSRCGPPDGAALLAEMTANPEDLEDKRDENKKDMDDDEPMSPEPSTSVDTKTDVADASNASNVPKPPSSQSLMPPALVAPAGETGTLEFPTPSDLNTRLRRIITMYQRNHKKRELINAQRARNTAYQMLTTIQVEGFNFVNRMERREKFEAAIREREIRRMETQQRWSRREEAEFYRAISCYGVDYDRTSRSFVWDGFRTVGRLERKRDDTLTEYFRAFRAMCRRVCGRKLTEEDDNLQYIVEPISEERATRCLQRIELLSKIREEVLPHRELDERLKLCQPSMDLPEWWICGRHDKDLLIGAAKYGLSRMDYHLLNDSELSFRDMVHLQAAARPPIPTRSQISTSGDAASQMSQSFTEDDRERLSKEIPNLIKEEIVVPPPPAETPRTETSETSEDLVADLPKDPVGTVSSETTEVDAAEERMEDAVECTVDDTKDLPEKTEESLVVEEEMKYENTKDNKKPEETTENRISALDGEFEMEKFEESRTQSHVGDKKEATNSGVQELDDTQPSVTEQQSKENVTPDVAQKKSLSLDATLAMPGASEVKDTSQQLTSEDDGNKTDVEKTEQDPGDLLAAMGKASRMLSGAHTEESQETGSQQDEALSQESFLLDGEGNMDTQVIPPGPYLPHFSRNPVRWPKDKVLQIRLEYIVHAVEKNEWPIARLGFVPASGQLPATPVESPSSPVASAASSTELTPHATPEHTPVCREQHIPPPPLLQDMVPHLPSATVAASIVAAASAVTPSTATELSAGMVPGGSCSPIPSVANEDLLRGTRRRRRRRRFEIEAERAKLRALLSHNLQQQQLKQLQQFLAPPPPPTTTAVASLPGIATTTSTTTAISLLTPTTSTPSTPAPLSAHREERPAQSPSPSAPPPPAHQQGPPSRPPSSVGMLDLRVKGSTPPPAAKVAASSEEPPMDLSSAGSSRSSLLNGALGSSTGRVGRGGRGRRSGGSRIDALALNLQARKQKQLREEHRSSADEREDSDASSTASVSASSAPSSAAHVPPPMPLPMVGGKLHVDEKELERLLARKSRHEEPPKSHKSHSVPLSLSSMLSAGILPHGTDVPTSSRQARDVSNLSSVATSLPGANKTVDARSGSSSSALHCSSSSSSGIGGIGEQAAAMQQDLKRWLDDHPELVTSHPGLAAAAMAFSPIPNLSSHLELLELPESRRRGRRPRLDPTKLDPHRLTGDENVSVINRLTGKKITGSKAPPLKHLAEWLEKNPMFDVDPKWSQLVKERRWLQHSKQSEEAKNQMSHLNASPRRKRGHLPETLKERATTPDSKRSRRTAASLLSSLHQSGLAGASSSSTSGAAANLGFPSTSALNPLSFTSGMLGNFPGLKFFMDPTKSATTTSSQSSSSTTSPLFLPFGGLAGMGLTNPLFGFPGLGFQGLQQGPFDDGKDGKAKDGDRSTSLPKSERHGKVPTTTTSLPTSSANLASTSFPFLYPSGLLYNPLGLGGFSLPTNMSASFASLAQAGLVNGLGGLGGTPTTGASSAKGASLSSLSSRRGPSVTSALSGVRSSVLPPPMTSTAVAQPARKLPVSSMPSSAPIPPPSLDSDDESLMGNDLDDLDDLDDGKVTDDKDNTEDELDESPSKTADVKKVPAEPAKTEASTVTEAKGSDTKKASAEMAEERILS
ncbi:chromodomain-helicase-DNA-binding protein 7-like isoform X3 [Ornithodoros turicata]|uniref:chromodomain-helicase-DNA-binding protein 7-like isoform X3 n=1 Tax=Ornithodoros turicata TaxID=34597 RepID=UPI003138C4D2